MDRREDARKKISAVTVPLPVNRSVVIQPTANVKIVVDGKLYYVRALVDAGSPFSRISENLARKMRIPSSNIDGRKVVPLTLRGRHGSNESTEVLARVSGGYKEMVPVISLNPVVKDLFPAIVLADSRFYEAGEVELMLGIDAYSKILRNGVMTSPHSQLVAQLTIFGYVMSGVYHL